MAIGPGDPDWALRTGAPVTAASLERVLLIGGTSEIGLAIVSRMAVERPLRVHLLGRDRARLRLAAATLERAGSATVETGVIDGIDLSSQQGAVSSAFDSAGGFDVVVLATGLLGAQNALDADPETVKQVIEVTFLVSGCLLWHSLRRLRDQGNGTLIVLSSVAAERPRAGNAIYGAAKAGLDALAQGLADAAASSGVRVLVVRPGFVKSRMTSGMSPTPFASTPEQVAQATVAALHGRAHTIWVPAGLRYLFMALRHLPRPVYRRLPL